MQDISGYFDWAATAPLEEDIIKESIDISMEFYGNPSSVHNMGTVAKQKLLQARQTTAKALGVNPESVFFTSGGTEANHIPILSLLQRPAKGTVLISAIEHPSIREQADMLKHCGWKINQVQPDSRGIITADAVEKALTSDTVLVCIMAVNNETGAVQPVHEIADTLVRISAQSGKRRAKLHVDCVQAGGKIPFRVNHKGIDSASFSAHKIGGPRGIGVLYLAQKIDPFLKGGGQEQGIRSGTENLAGAWAISKCLERYYILPGTPQEKRYEEQINLTSDFINKITAGQKAKIIPEERISLPEENYSPWVVQVAFKNIPGEVMVRALSEKGFYISTGSACSARKMNRPVLEAMGVSKQDATNAVRFSFGHRTTTQDIENLLKAVEEITSLFK